MNPSKNTFVTNGHWGFSTMTGHGIPVGYCLFQPHRMMPNGRFLRSSMNDLLVKREDADTLAFIHGFIRYYSRNLCHFQTNRSFRKHMGKDAFMGNRAFFDMGKRNHHRYLESKGIKIR